jgi:hypothetical protein
VSHKLEESCAGESGSGATLLVSDMMVTRMTRLCLITSLFQSQSSAQTKPSNSQRSHGSGAHHGSLSWVTSVDRWSAIGRIMFSTEAMMKMCTFLSGIEETAESVYTVATTMVLDRTFDYGLMMINALGGTVLGGSDGRLLPCDLTTSLFVEMAQMFKDHDKRIIKATKEGGGGIVFSPCAVHKRDNAAHNSASPSASLSSNFHHKCKCRMTMIPFIAMSGVEVVRRVRYYSVMFGHLRDVGRAAANYSLELLALICDIQLKGGWVCVDHSLSMTPEGAKWIHTVDNPHPHIMTFNSSDRSRSDIMKMGQRDGRSGFSQHLPLLPADAIVRAIETSACDWIDRAGLIKQTRVVLGVASGVIGPASE